MTTTVGEFLRKIRTERGIKLEQVSQDTRVKLAYLQAIEQNEPSELPSVVQARGFLRLYASYLNLPAQPLLDGWQSGFYIVPDAPEPEVKPSSTPIAESTPESTIDTLPAEVERELTDTMPENIEEKPAPVSESAAPRQSQQIFEDIGRQLQERRQELNLSIGDVERFTKLRHHYIETLEEGRIEELPSMVQGRGMLNSYAEFLDLDVENLLLQFADALQARRLEITASSSSLGKRIGSTTSGKKRSGQAPSWRRFLTLDLVLGGSLFIFLVAFVLWGAARITNLNREAAIPTPPSISEMLMTPANGSVTPTPEISATATNGEVSANALPGAVNPQDAANPTEFTIPTLNSAPISVYIVASQRAWMRVTVDRTVAFDGRVSPGNAYPFTGRERIDLITGNGAALSVIYNQNDLGILGRMGEVISISFTRDGTQVPTPVPTSTPTQTLQPTATRQPTLPQITPSITPLLP